MFRSLVLIGSIGSFLTAAMLPQGGIDARALAVAVAERGEISMGVASSTEASIQKAATILKTVSQDPKLKAALLAAHDNIPAADIEAASKALLALAPSPKTIAKKAVKTALNSMKKPQVSAMWKTMKAETDDAEFKRSIDRIEFATKKQDIRLCIDDVIPSTAEDTGGTATEGDYLALCIARITRDESRCDQISATLTIPLRLLCTEELAA